MGFFGAIGGALSSIGGAISSGLSSLGGAIGGVLGAAGGALGPIFSGVASLGSMLGPVGMVLSGVSLVSSLFKRDTMSPEELGQRIYEMREYEGLDRDDFGSTEEYYSALEERELKKDIENYSPEEREVLKATGTADMKYAIDEKLGTSIPLETYQVMSILGGEKLEVSADTLKKCSEIISDRGMTDKGFKDFATNSLNYDDTKNYKAGTMEIAKELKIEKTELEILESVYKGWSKND